MQERRVLDLLTAMDQVRKRISALKDQIKAAEAEESVMRSIAEQVTSMDLQKHFRLKAEENADKLKFQTGLREELRLHEQALRELEIKHAAACRVEADERTPGDVGPNESLVLVPRVNHP